MNEIILQWAWYFLVVAVVIICSSKLNTWLAIKKETNKPIWLWSGYLYEDIIKDEKKLKILNFVDVLIDGRFEIDKRNISLKYRGSSNQRVIDIKKSKMENKVIEIDNI